MPSFNQVVLAGHVTRDPEVQYTQSQTPVASFGIAINRKWTGQNGQEQQEVTFVDCEAWQRTAEVLGQYVRKGDPLLVYGRLKLDQWTDQSGQNRQKLKVVAQGIQMLGSKQDNGQSGSQQGRGNQSPPQGRNQQQRPSQGGRQNSNPNYDPNYIPPNDNIPF
ncbi:MAG: single-stranded DNA-binding protein [Sedimentisphaerales bacterium]|nr:single-stranded DNA-binding protein [Sedimentisphaerales bacterium]